MSDLTTWGLQLIAEIDPAQRDAIEDAIEDLICPDHAATKCRLVSQASTTGTDEQVDRWMRNEPPQSP